MSDGMSIDDEDIRITIEDDDDGPAPASSRKPVPTRRADAVEDHGRAFRELDAARRDLLEATKSNVEAALEARTSIASNLEREIQKALTEGDFESVTTGNRQLAKLEAERLESAANLAALFRDGSAMTTYRGGAALPTAAASSDRSVLSATAMATGFFRSGEGIQ
jgi:hypothetical protein